MNFSPLLLWLGLALAIASTAKGELHINHLPNNWQAQPTPEQYQRYAKKSGLTLHAYRADPAQQAAFIHYSAKAPKPPQEIAEQLQQSLRVQQADAGYKILLNQVTVVGGQDVLQQAWQYQDTVELRLFLIADPMHQLRGHCPASRFRQVLGEAQLVFLPPPTAPVDPSLPSAYEAGQSVGKFIGIVIISAIVVIVLLCIQNKRSQTVPSPQAAFSLDQLNKTDAPTMDQPEAESPQSEKSE